MGTPMRAAEVSLDGRVFHGAGEKAEAGEASTADDEKLPLPGDTRSRL
jgi:hypothetical protein